MVSKSECTTEVRNFCHFNKHLIDRNSILPKNYVNTSIIYIAINFDLCNKHVTEQLQIKDKHYMYVS